MAKKRSRLLRMQAVIDRVGMARSTIYSAIQEGRFPEPIQLSEKLVAWVENDIDKWIAATIKGGRWQRRRVGV